MPAVEKIHMYVILGLGKKLGVPIMSIMGYPSRIVLSYMTVRSNSPGLYQCGGYNTS